MAWYVTARACKCFCLEFTRADKVLQKTKVKLLSSINLLRHDQAAKRMMALTVFYEQLSTNLVTVDVV